MRILITGGAGFIGSNLVRWILERTDDYVINVDKLTYAGNLESLDGIDHEDRYEFAQLDICDAGGLNQFVNQSRPDAIMHLAAESHVDRSIDGPDQFINTNLVGTFNMLQAARSYWSQLDEVAQAAFRFLHVSTDEVYGSLDFEQAAFTEKTRYDPHSPYSASKAGSDHLVQAWHTTYGLPVLITNCSNNYGPFQFPEKLIPVVILKALSGQPIPVYGHGDNVRDWLYVDDHATALYDVVTKGRPGETYNIGGNNEQANIDVVRRICNILDDLLPIPKNLEISDTAKSMTSYAELIAFVEDRPGHDLRYAIDAVKIQDELGWKPRETFESGFRKTIRWYLENQQWWRRILSGEYRLHRQGLVDDRSDRGTLEQ